MHFSPANQLLHEVKEFGAEIHKGTPAWAQFPRWNIKGTSLWLESSSGSRLLIVNFSEGEISVPDWKVEMDAVQKYHEIPKNWWRLHRGSLFEDRSGAAIHREDFEWSLAQTGWTRG